MSDRTGHPSPLTGEGQGGGESKAIISHIPGFPLPFIPSRQGRGKELLIRVLEIDLSMKAYSIHDDLSRKSVHLTRCISKNNPTKRSPRPTSDLTHRMRSGWYVSGSRRAIVSPTVNRDPVTRIKSSRSAMAFAFPRALSNVG